jgi:uncharacterized delta-60 repeat protein
MKAKNRKTKATYFILFCLTGIFYLITSNAQAQAGSLDLSFDGDGIVTTSTLAGVNDYGHSTVIQDDGKILIAGYSASNISLSVFTLMRYNENGSLDATFGNDGIVTTPIGTSAKGSSIALQNDGKIVVAGNSISDSLFVFTIIRYNSNGSLDTSFDTDGIAITPVGGFFEGYRSVVIQPDGKIVVAGAQNNSFPYTDFAVIRLNTNGSLDSTFDMDGMVTTPVGTVGSGGISAALQADGKIVIVGNSYDGTSRDIALVRYNINGSLDSTFDTDGIVTTSVGGNNTFGHSLVIQTDGKIVVAGSIGNPPSNNIIIVRYNINGDLDSTFDSDGIVITSMVASYNPRYSVALQNDGKILITGSINNGSNFDFALVRLNTNGSLDNTFDTDGYLITSIGTGQDFGGPIAVQSDGKIVVAGYSYNGTDYDFAVVRYNYPITSGINNEDDPTSYIHIYPNPFTDQITIQTEMAFTDATLMVYNAMGQPVKQIYHIMGDLINFKREDLPAGVYFIHLWQNNQTLTTYKIIISD